MSQEILKKVLEIGISLSVEKDFDRLLEKILKNVMDITRCDAGTLYLMEEETLCPKISRSRDCADSAPRISEGAAVPRGRAEKFPGRIAEVSMKNRDGETIGMLQLINARDKAGRMTDFSEEMMLVTEAMASEAAVAIQNARYVEDIRGLFQSFVEVMSSAVDERTPYNLTHTKHMAEYGGRFVDYINQCCRDEGKAEVFDEAHKEEILMSIWLHDIGKIVTPLEVMNKDTRLRPDQAAELRHRMEKVELLTEIRALKGEITEEEKVRCLNEIVKLRELIKAIDHAGIVQDGVMEELESARELTYIDRDNREYKWFSEEEYEALTIRKGTLTSGEREIMEGHVQVTDKLLSKIKFSPDLAHVREWAAAHHELLNGTGYPNHLSGDEIPYEVRIITILDIFDALIADDRPYKPGMPVDTALDILTEMAEKEGKLDPCLTRLFIESRCWEKNDKSI